MFPVITVSVPSSTANSRAPLPIFAIVLPSLARVAAVL